MSRLTAALDRFPWLKTAREAALFALRRGREVRLQQVAGSLTFATVLSIVPLFAVALALFSVFPYFADFREAFQSLVQRTLPAQISSTVLRYLGEFAQQATRLTAAGLVFLGLTALAMIMTVDRVLNDIWQVHERRPLSQRVLIYWAIITLGPILIGASLTASSYLWSLSEDAIMRTPGWLRRLIDYAPVVLSGFAYAARDVGGQDLARGARTDLAEAERLLESLERLGYVRRLSAPRRRGESSEWILTCDPQTTSLRRAYERFAIDPANTLLALDRDGVGSVLNGWIARDEWINAPLDQSLPAAAASGAG